ncbi:MAG: M56 family metallopeptidase [Bacteroidales bacterium]|nr:M56 family metallopeptidase [Bacteroidales bacterium]
MTPFLLYIARAGLYLSLFYAFYLLVMRRTTFFRLNRALLIAGSYICLLLPMIRLRTVSATVAVSELTMVGTGAESAEQTVGSVFPWREVLLAVYAAGAAVTLALYMISAWKMHRIIRKGESTEKEGCRLIIREQDTPSFSWGRNVVISRKDLTENPAIFTHELMHAKCRHSLDLLLFLPLQIIFWWNPLVWITREELRLLHEYEADEGVIKKGIDATQYQLLLVRKAVGEHRFSLASGFQHAKLKNRIAMMLKPTTSLWIRWSYLALIPVLAAFMFACNPSKNTAEPAAAPESETKTVQVTESASAPQQEAVSFDLIERKPTFNGGDANEFAKWAYSQLKYPEQAIKDKAQGRVTVEFTIGSDGTVRDAKVVKGVREDLDAEALRVVSASPKWEPGYNSEGKAVPVHFNFPVVYKLQ